MRRALWIAPLALATLLLLPVAPVGAMTHTTIQPGDEVRFGNAGCTLNFVFDGAGPLSGKVFLGSAAHCIAGKVGISASTSGASDFGTVVYTGDYPNSINGGTAVENGIPGRQLDFLLIEVKPEFVPRVMPEVLGRAGMPSGSVTRLETATGDLVHASGYGMGFQTLRATRENRSGLLVDDTLREWRAEVPIAFGDSGGPLLHESGKALGVVSGQTFFPPVWYGPTLEGILAEMEALGMPIRLRTV